jgi:phosphoribosyl 1,2-cyclic phosphodiesterase
MPCFPENASSACDGNVLRVRRNAIPATLILDRFVSVLQHAAVRFAILGSGSGGNATLASANGLTILIDAGLSARQLTTRIEMMAVERIDAILLTHEHGDHVRGLKTFLKSRDIPIYATSATAHVLRENGIQAKWKTFEAGQGFAIDDLRVESFSILHDAVDPVGYVIRSQTKNLGIISDAGHVTQSVIEQLKGMHGLFLEANYDEDLLASDTKRPWSIKQRISSRHGHLSNKQAAELLQSIGHQHLRHVVLGHLSGDCNDSQLATATVKNALAGKGLADVEVCCACQDEPRGWWQL